ncbi:LysR family transcriptional regulator [Streptomycetaceae bacterium NBC_01309]
MNAEASPAPPASLLPPGRHPPSREPPFTLQELRCLVAVAEHDSLSAAAKSLFTCQSSVSRAVKSVERALRLSLLLRDRGRVRLTPHGESVVRLARRVLDGVDMIARSPNDAAGGRVRLGTPATLAAWTLTSTAPLSALLPPDIHLDVITCDHQADVFDQLHDRRLDLAVAAAPIPGNLTSAPLRTCEVVLASPRAITLPDPVPWAALADLPMILPARDSTRRADFEAFFAQARAHPHPALETDEQTAWIACATRGLGSVLWYRELAYVFGTAVTLRSFTPPLHRTLAIATPQRPLRPQARAVHDLLRRHARRGAVPGGGGIS